MPENKSLHAKNASTQAAEGAEPARQLPSHAPAAGNAPVSEAGSGSGETPHQRIAERAYYHWLNRGASHGGHEDDWFRAENELRSEQKSSEKAKPLSRAAAV